MDATETIEDERLIGIIRTESTEAAAFAAETALEAGLPILEFTWNTPGALGLIERFSGSGALIGVGTITDPGDAESAIASGARFVVTPVASRVVVDACRGRGIPIVCGTSTPTEMWNAHRWGADMIKVFPIAALGGVEYLKLVRGPLPSIPILATGGVTLDSMGPLLDAGARAVGITTPLFSPDLLASRDREGLTKRVLSFLARRPSRPSASP